MTHNDGGQTNTRNRTVWTKRLAPPLNLRQTAPTDWHYDRPAFAGDPFMDWESGPEPPQEPKWAFLRDQKATQNR